MKHKEHPTQCVVCGARIGGFHFGADNTCDSTCTRARNGNRSRYEQQTFEMEREAEGWERMEHERLVQSRQWSHDSGLNYNRPYLQVA